MVVVSYLVADLMLSPAPLAKPLLTVLSVAYVMGPQGHKKLSLENLAPNLLSMMVNIIYLVRMALSL